MTSSRAAPSTTAAPSRFARARVWLALLAAPLVLALVFAATAALLAVTRSLRGNELRAAIERAPALPTTIGFALVFVVTLALARKDGLGASALGWPRGGASPTRVLRDVVIGLAVAAAVAGANALALHPLIQRAVPSFDPTLALVPLPRRSS